MDPDIAYENQLFSIVAEALIGEVGPELMAVSVGGDRDRLIADVYVAAESEPGEGFVEDLVGEFDVLAEGRIRVRPHLWIGPSWQRDWPGRSHRLVFARREDPIDE